MFGSHKLPSGVDKLSVVLDSAYLALTSTLMYHHACHYNYSVKDYFFSDKLRRFLYPYPQKNLKHAKCGKIV